MKTLLFDTETTGLNPRKSFIISIGGALWDSKTDQSETFEFFLNWKLCVPSFKITDETYKVHRINQEFLDEHGVHPAKAFALLWSKICNFCKMDPEIYSVSLDHSDYLSALMDAKKNEINLIDIICAFNLEFDQNMMISNILCLLKNWKALACDCNGEFDAIVNLFNLFEKNYSNGLESLYSIKQSKTLETNISFIDSMLIDRIFHFDENGIKLSHNLEDVGLRYGIEKDQNAHDALSDSKRLLEIFKIQYNELKSLGYDLEDYSCRNTIERKCIRKSVFGKMNYRKKENLDYLGVSMTPLEF